MRCPLSVLLLLMALPSLAALPEAAELSAQAGYPPLLVSPTGAASLSRAAWEAQRAPELRQLIQHYEYGFLPPPPAALQAKVVREDAHALGGQAVLKEVVLTWGTPGQRLSVLLVVPKHVPKPAVFLGLSFAPYSEALDDPALQLSEAWVPKRPYDAAGAHRSTATARGQIAARWQIPLIIQRGYAVALFYPGELVPDDPAESAAPLRAFRPAARAEQPGPEDCATIAAWAWGSMRVVDFLQTESSIDARRIALVGHSRLGKTALLTAALDPRIALAIPIQAGCGGTGPSRVNPALSALQPNGRPTVETVARINTSFPHWFNGRFKQFNDEPARLPFDQHALLALCAPRPLLIAAAVDDVWANPPGQFQMARLADPVYRLLSSEGLDAFSMPEPGRLIASRLGWFIRPGKHEVNETDWRAFLDYADRWLR